MKAALITVTENGRKLSLCIAQKADFMSAERFSYLRHSDFGSRCFENLSGLVSDIFNKYDAIIFVCACGIAVRAIAQHIVSKTSDPAVIVIDDCGNFVIPILSGHIGKANAIAEKLAEIIGAQAVITTATDTGKHFSPDSFATANDLIITDMTVAKALASAVLDGEKIGFISDYKHTPLPKELCSDNNCRIGIYVGCEDKNPFANTLKLVPKNIVLGIGCRRGTSAETIEKAVSAALSDAGISIERVRSVATIDLKANENGLLVFCRNHGFELSVFSAKELMETKGDFTLSDFVKNITGTDNVCERSAVKYSGGHLILRKTARNGVTVAAAEMPVMLDFERKVL